MSMQALLSANQSLTRMQTMQSTRTHMQSSSRILLIESKLSGGIAKKEEKAAELEEKASDLMDNLLGEFTSANEELKPDEEVRSEEVKAEEIKAEEVRAEDAAKKDEAVKRPSQTDTIVLSDAAINQLGRDIYVKPAILETGTYNADGSVYSGALPKAASIFEATA